ncbi:MULTISPECIES: DUF559 domain-containing protein [Legionella]|uniref:Endonuclease domain-containing protein n=1 Tax=Legionella resiliens TaxID=2905958 RepID=A0ABS8X6C9_9GAMM|nr:MULTISPECIES: DUF559 domain-containing protein [unclassified Legionella]MCE0724003.1 endonuclease domain-containing protein [Legionella sp. 9fVS26]MCE3533156.1 endonuclease domain-containing protein [Legionella sp. 8cVS16]QLZ69335.1 hypothetical protein FOLKNPGA_02118 [Legionella sp. PC1000]
MKKKIERWLNIRTYSSISTTAQLIAPSLYPPEERITNFINETINAPNFNTLLYQIAQSDNSDCQEILDALGRVEVMLLNNKFQKIIDAQIINKLFFHLSQSENPQGLAVSKVIYVMGLIAHAGCLNGIIDAQWINKLLFRLTRCNVITNQMISNISYGLGLIGQSDCLSEAIETELIIQLLHKFSQDSIQNVPAPSIALYTLHGLGLLMQHERLTQKITRTNVEHLLKIIPLNRSKAVMHFAICCSYLGIPLTEVIEMKLNKMRPESQEIQNLLVSKLKNKFQINYIEAEYRLGPFFVDLYLKIRTEKGVQEIIVEIDGKQHYMENGNLRGKDKTRDLWLKNLGLNIYRFNRGNMKDNDLIHIIIQTIEKKYLTLTQFDNPEGQNKFIDSIEPRLKQQFTRGIMNDECINNLLSPIAKSENNQALQISLALYEAGQMSKSGHFNGPIDAQLINKLLFKLTQSENLQGLEISKSIQGVALMAQSGFIRGVIDALWINNLLLNLTQLKDLLKQELSATKYGLELIEQSSCISGIIEIQLLNTFSCPEYNEKIYLETPSQYQPKLFKNDQKSQNHHNPNVNTNINWPRI